MKPPSASPRARRGDGRRARVAARRSPRSTRAATPRGSTRPSRSSPLGAKDRAYLKVAAEFELYQRKNELLLTLEKIGGASKGGATPPGYRDWLAHTAEIYSDWLARLPPD